jgi:Recombination endonuclease VII
MKKCGKCKQFKSKNEFSKDKEAKDSLQGWCKLCMQAYYKTYIQSEQGKKVNKKYYESERRKELEKKYNQSEKGKLKNKDSALKYQYKITLEQYNKMVEKQGGVCVICRKPPQGKNIYDYVLHVDHNHTTDKVRGLVCYHCNLVLAHARDNSTLLRKAADYLDKNNT